ncbi:MAG: sigma-70 family RNA polymerase sigma factor [Chloroflexi bacterium]|nr:sigma-70 family RNA polymerase sigma factor [Chloroflexota bacterium]
MMVDELVASSAGVDALSDAEALERARSGDQDAFATVVRRYENRMGAYLRRALDDPELAADTLQETFLELHKAVQAEGPLPTLPGWLFRAATNNALDAVRRRKFRTKLRDMVMRAQPSSRDPGSETVERMAVRATLKRMEPGDRVCVLLSAQLGMDYHDIAKVLGIGEAAARQRVTRAKARFRKQYEQEL